jgi:hypothetical protein
VSGSALALRYLTSTACIWQAKFGPMLVADQLKSGFQVIDATRKLE